MSRSLLSSIVIRANDGSQVVMPVRPDIADALLSCLQEVLGRWGARRAGELSAYALLDANLTATEDDPQPPTGAQIKFALDIVRKLDVELPEGALQDRAKIGAFLTKFGGDVRRRRRSTT